MPFIVVMNAEIECDQAMPGAPNMLGVLPLAKITVGGMYAATVNDKNPGTNLKPFVPGCKSTSHPMAQVKPPPPPPYPCTPLVSAPWDTGTEKLTMGGMEVLLEDATCKCSFAMGTISIKDPGQDKFESP